MTRLIGIKGLAGHGKDTVANMIVKYLSPERAEIISFAEPLKGIVSILTGIPPEDINQNKTTSLPEYGMTVRGLLQKIGTDLLREQVHPEIWVKLADKKIEKIPQNKTVIISDVRFENEIRYIREDKNGVLFHVHRPGVILDETAHRHISELGQMDICESDYTIVNDGSLEDLQTAVYSIMDELAEFSYGKPSTSRLVKTSVYARQFDQHLWYFQATGAERRNLSAHNLGSTHALIQ
jgi:hypothetical protein